MTAKACHFVRMNSLAEIEAAADALSASEQRQLLLHLAARLQAPSPPPAKNLDAPPEPMFDWMAEDEAAMRRFRPNA